jgi:hypothetical protein
MSDLLTDHEEFLETSLEDPDYFGKPIIIKNNDASVIHNLTGQVNIVGRHLAGDVDGVTGQRSNCTIRAKSLAISAGYPDDVDWKDNLPVKGWIVVVEKGPLKELTSFTIEPGSTFPDDHLGLITYFLAKLDIT